jgi:hypothetical protein
VLGGQLDVVTSQAGQQGDWCCCPAPVEGLQLHAAILRIRAPLLHVFLVLTFHI